MDQATVKRSNKNRKGQQLRVASRKERPVTERALALLGALAAVGQPAALKELAGRCGLPAATAFRICQRMEQEGYLVREPGSRRYAIGVRLMRLGIDIVRASGPTSERRNIMAGLVDAIGETCNFTTMVGGEVVYLDRVETRWPLRLALEPGSRVPAHCTASGKLLLAHLPEVQRERMLGSLALTQQGPNSISTVAELRRELQRIAKRGFSTDREEFLAGLNAVAVPVRDRKGLVFAAVACHAPVARLDARRLIRFVPELQAAAVRMAQTFD